MNPDRIDNEFTVSVPIDQAWEVLTDLAGIAPCLPGAQLTGSEGDMFMGKIKIKVGPVTSQYAGTASFSEKDDAGYRAVIEAKGQDPRGAGKDDERCARGRHDHRIARRPHDKVPVAIGVAVVVAVVIDRVVR